MRGTEGVAQFRYNRKLAYDFSAKGIKNNPDFIDDSTFGQLYSQMITKDSEFKMMQNTDSSFCVD